MKKKAFDQYGGKKSYMVGPMDPPPPHPIMEYFTPILLGFKKGDQIWFIPLQSIGLTWSKYLAVKGKSLFKKRF